MARELWIRPTGDHAEIAGLGLEAGATGVIVNPDHREEVKGVGKLAVATLDGDKLTLPDGQGRWLAITSPEDQAQAKKLIGEVDVLVIAPEDWTIIPLENLVAWVQGTSTRLLARVRDAEEAEVALTTLETGVHGVVLETDDLTAIRPVADRVLAHEGATLDIVEGQVLEIRDAGMGDRVCVDTTSLLKPDEGLLVGSASSFLALVASEAQEAGYVASRPFRVNAGAVHAYVQATEGQTKYLSEVQAGTRLVVVDREGTTRTVTTGRAKVERRPMLLLRLQAGDREGTLVLQNAETIRLVTPDGTTSVSELAPGDTVYVHMAHEGGRHFGAAIDETIQEV